MSAYYGTGSYPIEIVGQDLASTEYGDQIILKILPDCTGERKERMVYLSLTDQDGNAAKYIDKTLDALFFLGFRGADFGVLAPDHPYHQSFVGKQCTAYCQVKDDKEKWYINTVKPVEKSGISRLNALFGKELKERTKATGEEVPAKQSQKRSAPQEPIAVNGDSPVGDDIPFVWLLPMALAVLGSGLIC